MDVDGVVKPSEESRALVSMWERIAMAIVAGSALAGGCGPSVGEPDSETGADSAASSDGGGTTGVGASNGGPVDSSGNDASADGPIPDVPTIPPEPGLRECFDFPPNEPACETELGDKQQVGLRCIPTDAQGSCDGVTADEALSDAQNCLACAGLADAVPCGPVASGFDTCCFWVVFTPGQSCPGRPFTVDGESRLPAVAPRDDWAERIEPELCGLDPATREVLARGWAEDGCFEHASVASFCRFVMELLAMGAPASLVADAQRAVAEEIDHARALFGLASAFGGARIGPAQLDIRGALASSHDPVAVAVALTREGCIAETISALQLQVAAARTRDPVVRTRLVAIAEQELQHAQLAWSALAWLMEHGDDALREGVARTFAHAAQFVPRASDASDALPVEVLREHGRLDAAERMALAERALDRLVAPAAAQLLERWTVTASMTFEHAPA